MADAKDFPGKTPISHRKRARDLLVQALYQWKLSGNDPIQIEAEFRADNGKKVDWEFFHHALSYIAEHAVELNKLYAPHLDRPVDQLDPIETGILLLGMFELSQRIDVPYKVVINECVELAKKYGATESHKYINGVLDKAARALRKVELGAS
ncbi:MAG: transcription antitermination factor NusB [Pseudomonadota bacterium]|nr:transcription antitermination factor NusB [Pseudomonadota bacterium]